MLSRGGAGQGGGAGGNGTQPGHPGACTCGRPLSRSSFKAAAQADLCDAGRGAHLWRRAGHPAASRVSGACTGGWRCSPLHCSQSALGVSAGLVEHSELAQRFMEAVTTWEDGRSR